MGRPLRIDFKGAVHHVIAKGNRGNLIFENNYDRRKFLFILSDLIKKYKFILYAYCLMDNHFHLLVETGHYSLSEMMRQLLTRYAVYYNKKKNISGHLFGDRYKSILVDKDNYFITVLRYIHRNPTKAHLVKDIANYRWSSYKDYIKMNNDIVDISFGMSYFNGDLGEFIKYMNEESDFKYVRVKSHNIYGDNQFIQRTLESMKKNDRKEARAKGVYNRIDIETINYFLIEKYGVKIEEIKKYAHDSLKKIIIVLMRYRAHYNYDLIGKLMNISASCASMHIKNYQKRVEKDLKEFDEWMEKRKLEKI